MFKYCIGGTAIRQAAACLGLLAASASPVTWAANDFPSRSIFIVTGEAGQGNDFTSRLVGTQLSQNIGRPVVVENRATAVIAPTVAAAPADGYTLLFGSGNIWVGPLIESLPYDPIKDLSPVTLAITSPMVLVVNPSVPAKSVKELVAYAKTKPGQLNYASSATGGSTHLAAELFKLMGGVNIVRVPYKGGAPAINAVAAGQVQMLFVTPTAVIPLAKAGKLRMLAVGNAKRSALLPDVPTVAESGLPGYESTQMSGFFTPAKVDPAIISRLNKEIVQILVKPDVKEKMANNAAEVVASTPAEFGDAIKKEMAVVEKLIKQAGIKPE